MGNTETKSFVTAKESSKIEVQNGDRLETVGDFGSYKNPKNPRPGYYIQKRKKEVYYRGNLIKEADSSTFVKLGQGRAKDKNHNYFEGKIVTN